jgi:hypothetical protein
VEVDVGSAADRALLSEAVMSAASAERFLADSITARVPVTLGKLEGMWKLFCPVYAKSHADKYGYGQRALTLYPVPGSVSAANSQAKYTAHELIT